MKRKVFMAEVKNLDDDKKRATSVISTASVDRDSEIILPEAFARTLGDFMKNPVFMWGHQWFGAPDKVLGRVVDVAMRPKGIEATFEYDTDINPTADLVWKQVKKGTLRGFSIGFIPVKWVSRWSDSDEINNLPDELADQLKNREIRAVYQDIELLEVSQVPIPSNRDAVRAASVGLRQPGTPSGDFYIAREISGLEVDELAAAAGVNAAKYRQFEAGLASLTPEEEARARKLLGLPQPSVEPSLLDVLRSALT